jgi:hypothetical protein
VFLKMERPHASVSSTLVVAALLLAACGGGGSSSDPVIAPFWSYGGVVAADFDQDGRVDVAVAAAHVAGPPPHPGTVFVYRQVAAGVFDAPLQYPVGADPWGIASGDIDGDGRLDIVVATPSTVAPQPGVITTTGGVSVLRQQPSQPGRFIASQWLGTGGAAEDVAVAALSGDAMADLIVADGVQVNGRALLLAQDATGSFAPALSALVGSGNGSQDVAVGDVDGDGRMDVVLAANNAVALLPQLAEGGLGVPVLLSAGLAVQGVALADIDGDGRMDIAAASAGNAPAGGSGGATVTVLRQVARNSFVTTSIPVADGARRIVIADLNADGLPDLAAISLVHQNLTVPSRVTVLLQSAANRGAFTPATVYDGPLSGSFIDAADLNGDGRNDIVINDGPAVLLQSATAPGSFLPVRPLR